MKFSNFVPKIGIMAVFFDPPPNPQPTPDPRRSSITPDSTPIPADSSPNAYGEAIIPDPLLVLDPLPIAPEAPGAQSEPVRVAPVLASQKTPDFVGEPALAEANEVPVLDIERKPTSKKVLPAALYAKRTRAIRTSEITVSMIETFLDNLEQTGLWEVSARRAALNDRYIRKLIKLDDDFKAMCDDAMAAYVDNIEQEAHRRAVEGWDEPVFSHKTGAQLGTIRKFDSNLIQMFLKRHRPEFGDKKDAAVSNTGMVIVMPSAQSNPVDWAKTFNQPPAPAALPAPTAEKDI